MSSEERSFNGSKTEPTVLSQYIEDVKKIVEKSSWKPKHIYFSPQKVHEPQASFIKGGGFRSREASNSSPGYSPGRLVAFEYFDTGKVWDDVSLSKHKRDTISLFSVHTDEEKKDPRTPR
ncbi:unnamed protein product [Phytomonas sp. Hart1]|nr:unnamed protein product [Phytomonas sp. Hart1]|eukprot:CCW67313.1 unnamed protein product [Phytomonas sp. isolate Hart1]